MKKSVMAAVFSVMSFLGVGQASWALDPACLAGGGSSNYTAPDVFEAGKGLSLELKLSRWGKAECMTTPVMDGFTEVSCHYRFDGVGDYVTQPMAGKVVDANTVSYVCDIPSSADAMSIDYYFDYKMNGVYSRRDEASLKRKTP